MPKRKSQTFTKPSRHAPKKRILERNESYGMGPGSYIEPSHPTPTRHLVSTEEPGRIDMCMPAETIGSHLQQYPSAFISACMQWEMVKLMNRLQQNSHLSVEGSNIPIQIPTFPYQQLPLTPIISIWGGEQVHFTLARQQMMGTGLWPSHWSSNAHWSSNSTPITAWGGSQESFQQNATAVNQVEGSNIPIRFPTSTYPYHQLPLISSSNIRIGEQLHFTSAQQQMMGTEPCPAQQLSNTPPITACRGSQESFQQNVAAADQDLITFNPNHESRSTSKIQLMQPAATEEELSEFLTKLQDDEGLCLVVGKCKDNSLQRTVKNIMQLMMTKSLALQFTWTGATRSKCGEKKKFRGSPAHEFLKKILGETSFANAEESEIQEALEKTFHNVPDWNGGRHSRMWKNHCDLGTSSADEPSQTVTQESRKEATEQRNDIKISDHLQLSANVRMFLDQRFCKIAKIFEGRFGSKPIVVKLVDNEYLTEAVIHAKLKHDNVVSLIEYGPKKDLFFDEIYLALEKCHHKNLWLLVKNHVDQKVAFERSYWLRISNQIISGVEYIHSMKIIHKDLKPENILVTLDKQTIKICDFGLSEEIQSIEEKKCCEGKFGTSGWRPPESFGNSTISLKSDIFSLGVVLCFVLSYGENPFGNDCTVQEHNIMNGIIFFPKLFVPNSKTTEHLIKCMIEQKLDDRPTIGEVIKHPCWTGSEEECHFDYRRSEDSAPSSPIQKGPIRIELNSASVLELKNKYDRRHPFSCEVATTSRVEMKNPSVQTSERNDESDADSESDTDDGSDTDDVSIDFESKMWSSLDQDTTHEKVNTLMKDLKFREAIALLEAHPVTEIQQMTLLECYIEVGEDTKIPEVVENMKTLMTQNPHRKAKDVLDFGEIYERNGSYIKAITLFACAGKLYLRESDGDEIVRGIGYCVEECCNAIFYMIAFHDPMVKQNAGVAGNVVMKIMNEFIDDIMSVENADPDKKVKLAVMCLHNTGQRYEGLRNYDKMKESYERGIDIMNKHFGSNSSEYFVFGFLLERMGDALCKLGNNFDAESFYRRAIDAYKPFEDLDDGKKRFIEGAERKLDDLILTNLFFGRL